MHCRTLPILALGELDGCSIPCESGQPGPPCASRPPCASQLPSGEQASIHGFSRPYTRVCLPGSSWKPVFSFSAIP